MQPFVADFSTQLGDNAPVRVSVARAGALWIRSGLSREEFTELMYRAREITLAKSGGITKLKEEQPAAAGFWGPSKARMAYWFEVLENEIAKLKGVA